MLAKADFAGLQFLQQWEGHPLVRLRWACIHLCTLLSLYIYIIIYLSESYLRRHMRRCAQAVQRLFSKHTAHSTEHRAQSQHTAQVSAQ